MLGPVDFTLPDGRRIQPLAVAPWGADSGKEHDALPSLLKRLRGEWPCVPFGAPKTPEELPAHWTGITQNGTRNDFHGYAANHLWTCTRHGPDRLCLGIDYPEDHVISSLSREITGVAGAAELAILLRITARIECRLPVALHPVFALPSTPGMVEIVPDRMSGGHTYPIDVEPGVSRLITDRSFDRLAAVPSADGPVDLSCLPLPFDTEEILQIFGVGGRVTLRNMQDRYESWVAFGPEIFPSVLLWISNRGRRAYPWNGRFLAVGIEPARSAFDLGTAVGAHPGNPIARSGVQTALVVRFRHLAPIAPCPRPNVGISRTTRNDKFLVAFLNLTFVRRDCGIGDTNVKFTPLELRAGETFVTRYRIGAGPLAVRQSA
jgi:hypothetical protein